MLGLEVSDALDMGDDGWERFGFVGEECEEVVWFFGEEVGGSLVVVLCCFSCSQGGQMTKAMLSVSLPQMAWMRSLQCGHL